MYRVKYKFRRQQLGWHYTEWYDTLDEAKNWVEAAENFGELFPLAIENEDGSFV